MVATGNQKGASSPAGYAGLIFVLLLGALGVFPFLGNWANRRTRILLNATGPWVENGSRRNVIPWQSLAGAARTGASTGTQKVYSLELFPAGPIDRDDPVLWLLVRDEEPLHPDLPAPCQQGLAQAVQQHVPHIWLGESERATGHIGRPDVRGHRRPHPEPYALSPLMPCHSRQRQGPARGL